jgi:2-polyprenyl-3-methyl-5-hydroxy-6-metoxy-1,4-benzoquinol methylase
VDKAGTSYWDKVWEREAHSTFAPGSTAISDYRDTVFAAILDRALEGMPADAAILEAGCADSALLTYLGRRGYRITGVDYSVIGCTRFRERLRLDRVTARVECCDIFDPTPELKGCADLVISNGLVEHFTDTTACIAALANFARPGGRILTIIPNMRGLVGLAQRLCAPSIYRVHVPLGLSALVAAHRAAGLGVTAAAHLLPIGFGVVNFHEPDASPVGLMTRRLTVGVLSRLSWLVWRIDRYRNLPTGELLSPYAYCMAERAAIAAAL